MKLTITLTPAMIDAAEKLIADRVMYDHEIGNLDAPPLTMEQAVELLVITGALGRNLIRDTSKAYR